MLTSSGDTVISCEEHPALRTHRYLHMRKEQGMKLQLMALVNMS